MANELNDAMKPITFLSGWIEAPSHNEAVEQYRDGFGYSECLYDMEAVAYEPRWILGKTHHYWKIKVTLRETWNTPTI